MSKSASDLFKEENLFRDFKGIWIPRNVWLSDKLSMQEKCFLGEINSLSDNQKGYCWASNRYLAAFFQLSPSRCSEIVNSLKKKEAISIIYLMKGKEILQRRITVNNLQDVFDISKGGIRETEGGYSRNTKDITYTTEHIKDKSSKEDSDSKESHRSTTDDVAREGVAKKTLAKKKFARLPRKKEKDTRENSATNNSNHCKAVNSDWFLYLRLKRDKLITAHQSNTKAETNTLNLLHRLRSKTCKHPYVNALYDTEAEYKTRQWTDDEIIQLVQEQFKRTNARVNLGSFIFTNHANVKSPYSPLVALYKQLLKTHNSKIENDKNPACTSAIKLAYKTCGGNGAISDIKFMFAADVAIKHIKPYYEIIHGTGPDYNVFQVIGSEMANKTRENNFKEQFITKDYLLSLFEDRENRTWRKIKESN